MEKNKKQKYAFSAFLASIPLGLLYIYLFTWKVPGISHFIFYSIYFVLAIAPVFAVEKEKALDKLTSWIVVLPVTVLLSTVFLYRLHPGWLSVVFMIFPFLYGIILTSVFFKETVVNFNLFSFVTLPVLLAVSWFGDIVRFIKNFSFGFLKSKRTRRIIGKSFLGFVIAIPFLVIFASLFASADEVYREVVTDLVKNIFGDIFKDFDSFLSFIVKFVIGVVVSVYSMIYYFSLWNEESFLHKLMSKRGKNPLKEGKKNWDFVIFNVFLGLLNLLFLSFVIVQFGYIFGGESNILGGSAEFTYAKYARKGFWELSFVAILSYLIMLLLSLKVKAKSEFKRAIFRGNFLVLAGSVMIITYSAFARISLYESIYGFTQLRILVNLGIIFIALMYVALIYSLFIKNPWRFTNKALSIMIIVFSLAWLMIPTDLIVAQLNYNRYFNKIQENKDEYEGPALDLPHLLKSSDEAVPVILKIARNQGKEGVDFPETTVLLAKSELQIRYDDMKKERQDWQSFNLLDSYNKTEIENLLSEDVDWEKEAEKDLTIFLENYCAVLEDENFKEAYREYWTRHSESLDLEQLKDIDIKSCKISSVPERRNWSLVESESSTYWMGMGIYLDIKYSYTAEQYDYVSRGYQDNEVITDRSDYIKLVLEEGEWKIKDSSYFTLGNFQDGNKGVKIENRYFEQNSSFDQLYE